MSIEVVFKILTACLTADDPSKPTKGEMAKAIRLLIANARDDEELFNELGRHWWATTLTLNTQLCLLSFVVMAARCAC